MVVNAIWASWSCLSKINYKDTILEVLLSRENTLAHKNLRYSMHGEYSFELSSSYIVEGCHAENLFQYATCATTYMEKVKGCAVKCLFESCVLRDVTTEAATANHLPACPPALSAHFLSRRARPFLGLAHQSKIVAQSEV